MFFDESLARRLEAQNRWFYAGLGSSPGTFLDLGDTFAFYGGEDSPHTVAYGLFERDHLEAVQAFYRGKTDHWQAQVTPYSPKGLLPRLMAAGGEDEGWENLYYRPTSDPLPTLNFPKELEIREAKGSEVQIWADQCAFAYFGETGSPAAREFHRLISEATNFRRYLAFWDDEPVAVASLTLGLGVGFLGDMRTLPEYRGRGIQTALVHHRLAVAASEADLVVVGTVPGNASYRNVDRAGFRVAYSYLTVRVPVSQ